RRGPGVDGVELPACARRRDDSEAAVSDEVGCSCRQPPDLPIAPADETVEVGLDDGARSRFGETLELARRTGDERAGDDEHGAGERRCDELAGTAAAELSCERGAAAYEEVDAVVPGRSDPCGESGDVVVALRVGHDDGTPRRDGKRSGNRRRATLPQLTEP